MVCQKPNCSDFRYKARINVLFVLSICCAAIAIRLYLHNTSLSRSSIRKTPTPDLYTQSDGLELYKKMQTDRKQRTTNRDHLIQPTKDTEPSKTQTVVIKHNYPHKTEVKKAGNHPYGITYKIKYSANLTEIISLMNGKSCRQFLRYDCLGSVISHKGTMWAFWRDREGKMMEYWPGGPPGGFGCYCGIHKTCAGGHFCNCEMNDSVWRYDEGFINDTDRLPVSSLYFSDTDDVGEMGYFTLGDLVCP